jgi:hypothetical protein
MAKGSPDYWGIADNSLAAAIAAVRTSLLTGSDLITKLADLVTGVGNNLTLAQLNASSVKTNLDTSLTKLQSIITNIDTGTNVKLEDVKSYISAVYDLIDTITNVKVDAVTAKVDDVHDDLNGGTNPKLDSAIVKLDDIHNDLNAGTNPKLDSAIVKIDDVHNDLNLGTNVKLDTALTKLTDTVSKLTTAVAHLLNLYDETVFANNVGIYTNSKAVSDVCTTIMAANGSRKVAYLKNVGPNVVRIWLNATCNLSYDVELAVNQKWVTYSQAAITGQNVQVGQTSYILFTEK